MTNALVSACSVAVHRIGIRFPVVMTVFASLSVLVISGLQRRVSPSTAADDTLLGVVFGLAIPLCTYSAVGKVSRYEQLLESTEPLAKYGANRRLAALGFVTVAAGLSAALGALLAFIGVAGARGISDPSFSGDALTSARIGVFAGLVYAAWFGLGSALFRRGRARFVVLALDWVFGSSTAAVALPLPRAHIANLLGAEPLLEMTQRQASFSLFALGLSYVGLALWRTPP